MIRFYLDEHLPVRTAVNGRALGFDVESVVERETRGWEDDAQLGLATSEGRALVSRNYRDFTALASVWAATDRRQAGIVFVPASIEEQDAEGLPRALSHFADLYPDGIDDATVWLSPVARS